MPRGLRVPIDRSIDLFCITIMALRRPLVVLHRGVLAASGSTRVFTSSSSQTLPGISAQWVTTGLDLPGCRVVESKGLVTGVVVRGRNFVVDFIGHFQALLGGNLTIYSSMCNAAREEALGAMLQRASDVGANAVIGVRFDTGSILNATEVLCYGTAVVIASEHSRPRYPH